MCAVCDQFCRASSSSLIEAKSLPSATFSVLAKPAGTIANEAPILNHLLAEQYDVSEFFLGDNRFQNILMSPRGIERQIRS